MNLLDFVCCFVSPILVTEDIAASKGGQAHLILVAVPILGGGSMPFPISNCRIGPNRGHFVADPETYGIDKEWVLVHR